MGREGEPAVIRGFNPSKGHGAPAAPRPPLPLTSGLKIHGTAPTCCSLPALGQGFSLFSAMGSFQGCGGWSRAQEDDGPRWGGISGSVASWPRLGGGTECDGRGQGEGDEEDGAG